MLPNKYVMCFLSQTLQIRGEHLDSFISQSQDRARNAHEKSLQAAFSAWAEDLKADQSKFEADLILTLGLCFIYHFVLGLVFKTTCR